MDTQIADLTECHMAMILLPHPVQKIMDLLNVCESTVTRWRTGESLPKPGKLVDISIATGTHIEKVRAAYTHDYNRKLMLRRQHKSLAHAQAT